MEAKLMEEVLKTVDNRYEMIKVVALEAKRINTIIRLSGEEVREKPTTIALKRVIDGKVKYEYAKPSEEA